jgi:hypothetical protein
MFVPPLLHQNIQRLSILIDRAPQIMAVSIKRDKPLVDVPRIAQSPSAIPELLGKGGTKFQAPLAHGFITDRHAALGQELFDIAKAEAETRIAPHGIRNDLRRKTVTMIVGVFAYSESSTLPPPLPT